jgi:hypothetical protein
VATHVVQHLDDRHEGDENTHANGVGEPAFVLSFLPPLTNRMMPEMTAQIMTVSRRRRIPVVVICIVGPVITPGPYAVDNGKRAEENV